MILAAGIWRLTAGRQDGARAAERAFTRRMSGVVLTIPGRIVRILSDDERPPRHQRFIIRTVLGQSLLVLHNIDVAARVPVRVGDMVTVRGEYVWNEEGGLVHRTHGQIRGGARGWIRLDRSRRTYR